MILMILNNANWTNSLIFTRWFKTNMRFELSFMLFALHKNNPSFIYIYVNWISDFNISLFFIGFNYRITRRRYLSIICS